MIVLKKTMFWKFVCDYTGKENIKDKGKKSYRCPYFQYKKEIPGQRILVASGNLMLSVASQENQCRFPSPDLATNRIEGPMLPW